MIKSVSSNLEIQTRTVDKRSKESVAPPQGLTMNTTKLINKSICTMIKFQDLLHKINTSCK